MDRSAALRRVAGIGMGWGLTWALAWTAVGTAIGIVNPEAIDPGEEPLIMGFLIFGPMGVLSGVAFALLSGRAARGDGANGSVARGALYGALGSALAQVPYLGHGDRGLAANAKVATLFVAFGGLVAVLWVSAERAWRRRRRAD